MRKVREDHLEIYKTELRCYFCYCSLKEEIIYNLEEVAFYHYECILEKFRANEIDEFRLKKIDGSIENVKVTPENKKTF